MRPIYPAYPFHLENCDNLGDFDGDFHGNLRDRMREIPLMTQEAAIVALDTFSDYYYPQIGPYHNVLVGVGFDVSIDIHLHRRTILLPENWDALTKLVLVLNAVTGAVCIRFVYGSFADDLVTVQWDFSRRSWRFKQGR